MIKLADFVRESNRIEGIRRKPLTAEIAAHRDFLASDGALAELEHFVSIVQPGAVLRRSAGMNVRVGNHVAPPGGPGIETELRRLLAMTATPYQRHCAYETLHPFMDGNGRSGRVLWLRDMGGLSCAPLGFLHHWYYQSLAATGR